MRVNPSRAGAWLAAAWLGSAAFAHAADAVPSFFKPIAKVKPGKPVGILSPAAPVAFNAEQILAMQPGGEADLPLPNGKSHRVILEKKLDHGRGDRSWVGYVKERGKQSRVIVTSGAAGSYGVIETAEGVFRIVPGNGNDWLVDEAAEQRLVPRPSPTDDGIVVEDHGLPPANPANATFSSPQVTGPTAKVAPTPQAVIDIMFVITQGLANRLGATLPTRLNFLVTRANDSYLASDVAMTLRMVNYTVVNFPDNSNDGVALGSITPTCTATPNCSNTPFNAAVFGNIETLRTQYGADLVHFWRDGSSFGGSGIAWVPRPATSNLMYSTVQGCVSGCESVMIHEIGHNMGNSHDRYTAAQQAGGIPNTSLPAANGAYGYPFCKANNLNCNPNLPAASGGCSISPECATDDPSNFADLMAYFHQSQTLYRFSNPLQSDCKSTEGGNDGIFRPCGVAVGNVLAADTAGSMNATRAAISGVKATVVAANMPGSLQFTASSYSGSETGGTITFTVSRANGSGGAVSVNYSVASNTAISGIDFAATSGTLNWADGDTANKSFSVTLTNDNAAEGNEILTATLSAPGGAAGVSLGFPNTAIGTIIEAWPPGGAIAPAGFGSAPGSAGPWNFASDFSADGDGVSLKSAAVNFAVTGCSSVYGSIPCPTALQWQGTLPAGTVSFVYQVNSYPGNGFFEFIIDGAVLLSDSGVPGAKAFSTNVTAGPHTLVWQYRPFLPFECAFADPQPPQGGSCADRAWIDAVSLPTSLPASSVTVGSSLATSGLGQAVTFTASVTGANGGTVAFRDNGALIAGCNAQAIASNQATCTTSALGAGAHSITAAYSGSTAAAASISAAITQTVISNITLTVTKSGAGNGTITSAPAAIACGATCLASISAGSPVTLTATPAGGSVFTGWSGGGCSGVAPCTISPTAATTVTGTFAVLAGTPTLVLNGPTLDFGGQSVKTSTPSMVLYLVNAGTGSLSLTSITPSTADFTALHACTTIASGAACPVTVRFTPQAAGPRAGSLAIVTDGGTLSPAMTGVGEQSLVTHYYRSILNRAPDGAGKAFWEGEAARLTSLSVDVNETWYVMAGYFFNSAEYLASGKSDAAFVGDLYLTFFNRAADFGGLTFWVGQIAGGLPREVVLFSFMFSPEFRTFTQDIFGNTASRPEVNVVMDFFRGILNRIPDTSSFQYWLGRMRTAQCAGAGPVFTEVNAISAAFIFNPEYNNRGRNNTQFVTDMYYSFLRRGGDAGGVNFWINQLNTSQMDINTVRTNFLNSPEFGARVQAVINAGCFTGP